MKGDIEMHQIRLTNKQMQELITEFRKNLKTVKTITNTVNLSFKFPKQEKPPAKLVIKLEAWLKIQALVDQCDKEIAWHGLVTKHGRTYTIEDILVFPQTVTGTTVTSDETAYSLWLAQQPDEVFNKIRFHGHSHVNMGTTPSGVDTTYQEDIIRNLQDFYIFGIFNKKGSNWCTIYDVEDNIVYEDDDIELITPDVSAIGWAIAAIKEYVDIPKPAGKPKAKKKEEEKTAAELREEDDYVYGNNPYADYTADGYRYYGGYGYYGQK